MYICVCVCVHRFIWPHTCAQTQHTVGTQAVAKHVWQIMLSDAECLPLTPISCLTSYGRERERETLSLVLPALRLKTLDKDNGAIN